MMDPAGYVIDDHLAHEPLRALGWRVDWVPWNREGVDWCAYDVAVIRSTWDYQLQPDAFLAVLAGIEQRGVRLENGLELVRWNSSKTYLRDLAALGVPTAPSVWREELRRGDLPVLFDEVASDEIVIKPVVSANAMGTWRLDRTTARARASELESFFAGRPFIVQPMARAILGEGEYSLFYFNGAFSHAILKTPKAGDFRVQEEHGGVIRAVKASRALRDAGAATLKAVGDAPLYARADFVRSNAKANANAAGARGDAYWLMELELIEPALYLRMDAGAPTRFARALDARMAGGQAASVAPQSPQNRAPGSVTAAPQAPHSPVRKRPQSEQ